MTMTAPRPCATAGPGTWAVLLAGSLALLLTLAAPAIVRAQANNARQVTVFGIIAVPNSQAIDPKLEKIELQLRKLLPNHGFKLIEVKSKRLLAGQAVRCDLGGGWTVSTILIEPLDDDGKVRLRCDLLLNEVPQFETLVSTPPNQLFFCDRMRADGSHLLIGIGAR
jgi:hypothetical protein